MKMFCDFQCGFVAALAFERHMYWLLLLWIPLVILRVTFPCTRRDV